LADELTVSIDAMGGDAGPSVVVSAVQRSMQRHPGVKYILHGDEKVLGELIAKRKAKFAGRVSVRHAATRVGMDEKPSFALRRRRDSSLWHAIALVKSGEAEAVVSAGNTGALMAMGMYQLGVIDGISRPAIASVWPTQRGQVVVLDCGANVECDPQNLVDFAIMGEALSRALFGLPRPRVGLVNVGSEEVKGHEGVRTAAHTLRNSDLPMEFCGFIEGNNIAEGVVDVAVMDGFTGNIVLKMLEGTAKLIAFFLKSALKRSLLSRIGAILAAGALLALRRKLDPRAYGGGLMLGLNGIAVKAHGGTDAIGFAYAIDTAINLATAGVNKAIVADRAGVRPEEVTL
jgi:glycerol-3-phosphate acyltransferase PlsX